ncbi:MAG: isopentenyl phosphate kinase [Thermoplasmatota archaeon]
MKVVKLGGSVITNKRAIGAKPVFRAGTAARLLREIRSSGQKVVVVTGAGSFGHVLARRYGLADGFREERQWSGFVEVARDVRRLNLMVLDAALRVGIRAISVPPSICAVQMDGRIHFLDTGVFRRYLERGITPITFGDVCLDLSSRRFSICSGDALAQHLSREFGADRAVFVSDVDGVFVGGAGELAKEFKREDLERITLRRGGGRGDATGGMREKARIALEMAGAGTETVIVNGMKRGRLLEALSGGYPPGTWFRRS